MFKRSLLPIVFSTLAITQVSAAEVVPVTNSSDLPVVKALALKQPARQLKECESYAKTMRIAGRHIEAGGIGYNKGYTTLEGFFAPSPANWGLLPFLDLRGHLFNDGRFAANAGFGFRLLRGCRIYGINGYYDYRKTKHQHYNQFTLGLETLGDVWDFRVNGYLPFGDKKSKLFGLRFDHFSGNEIILSERVEYTMKGGDAELGFHFGRTANWDSWIAAGPYYFIGEFGGPRWGAKGRIGATFREYLTLEFINSWDRTFHYRPQGQITFGWPFGPKAKTKRQNCPCSISERLIQPVSRQEIIVVDKATKDKVAINPVTDLPFFVIFVDNTSSSNGTFESPYSTLAQAESTSLPGDIIYVFPGDGTTTNLDTGFALQPNQAFWGSGVSHELITILGTVDIPAQTVTNPLITNTTGSAITLNNNTDVSGFSITRPNLHGVDGSNVTNVALSNLWIFAAQNTMGGGNGINIIENNGIVNNIALFNLFVTNNAKNGIFVETDGTSSANLVIENSTITTNGAGVVTSSGIVIRSTMTSNMNAALQNNVITHNANIGLLLDSASTGTLNYQLAGNTIEDHNNFGISGLFTGASTVTATLTGNTITRNIGTNQFTFIGPALFTAENNHFDQIEGVGCQLIAGNATFSAVFKNNTLNQNNSGGLIFFSNGSQNVTFTIQNNDMSYNCGPGINIEPQPGMVLNVEMLGNTINGNCSDGVFIGNDAATIIVVANDNIINGNCNPGMTIAPGTLTTALIVDLNNNTIMGNCGIGLQVLPTAQGFFTKNFLTSE